MTTEKNNLDIQTFLGKIAAISVKHSGISKKEQLGFNVFSILRRETEEVGLHSAFLFALLDPKGAHEHKTVFLNVLMDVLGLSDFTDAKFERSGKEMPFDNGRIDLYFQQGDRALIIENKIDAKDQPKQLARYINWAIETCNATHIDVVYLTFDGSKPGDDSLDKYKHLLKHERDDQGVQLKLASYKFDIVKWLEHCIPAMALYPTTRETLFLYKRLVLKMTGQSYMEAEKMELLKFIMDNEEHLRTAMKIIEVSEDLKQTILGKALNELKTKVEKESSIITNKSIIDNPLECQCFFSFNKPAWPGFEIHLQPQISDGGKVLYGVKFPKDKEQSLEEEKVKIKKREINKLMDPPQKTNDWWVWYNDMPAPYNNLTSSDSLIGLQFGDGVEVIFAHLNNVSNKLDDYFKTESSNTGG